MLASEETMPVPPTETAVVPTNPNDLVPETRAKVVKQWIDRVQKAERFHDKAFKRMRRNAKLARYGAEREWIDRGNYTLNLIRRMVKQKVSDLYAKNPTVDCRARKKLRFKLWDGLPQTLQMAQQAAMQPPVVDPMSGMVMGGPDPNAMALLQEVEEARIQLHLANGFAKTASLLGQYWLDDNSNEFKRQFKKALRRCVVTGVAYVGHQFYRSTTVNEEILNQLKDSRTRKAELEARLAMSQDPNSPECKRDEAALEELKLSIQAMQGQTETVEKEGILYFWPESTAVIPDPRCRRLVGFEGADWIAIRTVTSPKSVLSSFKVNIRGAYDGVKVDDREKEKLELEGEDEPCVIFRVFNKLDLTEFVICPGYDDFLEEPKTPSTYVEDFWPVSALVMNECEDEEEIFPESDVDLISAPQNEYLQARQGLREHRRASRPVYLVPINAMDIDERKSISDHDAFEIIPLKGMQPGQKSSDVLSPLQKAMIDPALYETDQALADMELAMGYQSANLGPTAGGTATESSIAEGSRSRAASSDTDTIDEFLSKVVSRTNQTCLEEMSEEEVKRIVGPGAVWPILNQQQIADEVEIRVRTGSSGRPNREMDIAMLERAAPIMLQIPGLSPMWLGRRYLDAVDPDTDLDEALVEGMPSIIAQNAMARGAQAQVPPTDATQDPQAQGAEGGDKQQRPEETAPGPQPAYPTATDQVAGMVS